MYLYANGRRPTVDEMWGDYKIAQLHLTLDEFVDLYPEVTKEEMKILNQQWSKWVDEHRKDIISVYEIHTR